MAVRSLPDAKKRSPANPSQVLPQVASVLNWLVSTKWCSIAPLAIVARVPSAYTRSGVNAVM
jgi:hypothetical protein